MNLNSIFYENEYEKAYTLTKLYNWTIVEIEADENGRRFKLVEIEPPTEKELTEQEINELKSWLDTYYTQHEQKYRRLHTLGLKCDNGANPYNELVKLYNEAETKRKRIQEIEELIK